MKINVYNPALLRLELLGQGIKVDSLFSALNMIGKRLFSEG